MGDHYYTEVPGSAHAERAVTVRALGQEMTFVTDAGVFSRDGLDRGTEVLLNALPPLSQITVLSDGAALYYAEARVNGKTWRGYVESGCLAVK